jgi:hypothetical protein
MMSLKEVFDRDFLLTHNIPENKRQQIKQECTNASDFDLIDPDPKIDPEEKIIVEFGKGTGSFGNNAEYNIEILAYDNLLKSYNNYNSFKGVKICDFILYSNENSTIVLNDHTSSIGDKKKLEEEKDSKTGMTKFQKAEKQLSDTLGKLQAVDSLNGIIEKCTTKICLLSYRLFYDKNNPTKALIAFNRAPLQIAKATGEEGAKFSCPDIDEKGFEFRKILHNYKFKLS